MLPIFFARDWVPGNDTYYHMVMARFPFDLALADTFPWLQWTLFRDQFVNHHLGFQFLLFPLVWLSDVATGNLVWGGQAALLICSGLTAMCFYRLLVLRGVPHPLLWTFLLGVLPWHFWMRQAYVRAPIVALPMMLFAIELMMRRKPLLLGMWACAFMLAYFGAVLFAMLTGCMLAGWMMTEGLNRRLVRVGAAMVIGLTAGFALHPSFPENIEFMRVQLFDSGLSAAVDIGNEWKPPDAWFAAVMWLPLLVLWLGSIISSLVQGRKIDGTSVGLMLLTALFLLLTAKMRRFVEYAPVFMLLSAADLFRWSLPSNLWSSRLIRVSLILVIAAAGLSGPLQARWQTEPAFHAKHVSEAMTWMQAHTPKNSVVFTDDWDVFPGYFYFNRHNRYVVGLDPMFTAIPYPEHWRRYKSITRGQAAIEPDDVDHASLADIGDLFLADYVMVQQNHRPLYDQLQLSRERFQRIYPEHDEGGQPPLAVFKVLGRD